MSLDEKQRSTAYAFAGQLSVDAPQAPRPDAVRVATQSSGQLQ